MSKKIWHLCKAEEISPGTVKQIELHDASSEAFALFNLGGVFHLTEDTCTHGFASLSQGTLDDHIIICPLHGGAFDILTGKAYEAPCTLPIKKYRVWREGEDVVSDLSVIEQPAE